MEMLYDTKKYTLQIMKIRYDTIQHDKKIYKNNKIYKNAM